MVSRAMRAPARADVAPEVPLAEKRAFLESGAAWPGEPQPECIETHASLVFLTRDRAWKLKKPVRLMHIDQRTLRARAHLCRDEIRLNRELAGEIYRGLTPLVQPAGGGLALGGPGRVVDWLVESVRLPATEMLIRRIEAGPAPEPHEIAAVSDLMIAFYRSRPRSVDAGPAYAARLLREARINIRHLGEWRGRLGPALRDDVLETGLSALAACRSEIIDRAAKGIVVEGHGDLRPEHVCLTDPPVVFDRVEFDHGVRLADPFDEFNALGVECGLAGAEWIGPMLLSGLERAGLPRPSGALLRVYGLQRCLTRARLAIDHLRNPEIRAPRNWPEMARRYLRAAARLCDQPVPD